MRKVEAFSVVSQQMIVMIRGLNQSHLDHFRQDEDVWLLYFGKVFMNER